MQLIPLQAIPAQSISVQLNDQSCLIDVYQTAYGLFCDLYLNNVLVVGGVICQNLNRIVRDTYLGFIGDLCFIDQQGTDDPDYTGLDGRFAFVYLAPIDLVGIA